MKHGLCINVMIIDEGDLKLAEKDRYNGMVSNRDLKWSGPLSVGDHIMINGFGELLVEKLLHWPDESHPLGNFEQPFTEVFGSASKATVDRILSEMPDAWEKRDI